MVFCRKSTLLCRQLVRRSMVFSTVQISMPGTSCARASGIASMHAIDIIGVKRTIRPAVKILIGCAHGSICWELAASHGRIPYGNRIRALRFAFSEKHQMATRERRLAEFNGEGE